MPQLPKETADKMLRMFGDLISACEQEFCSEDTESGEWREPDDSAVASGIESESAITFGMIRDARAALNALQMLADATYSQPA